MNAVPASIGSIETVRAPLVDVTIAVHSAARPIGRIVGSILDGTIAPVRVNVVAHNIDPRIIQENLGAHAADGRVRLLELRDGIASPAGPLNHGLAASTAPFISVAGSDDEFSPGAIDSWLDLQAATSADVVMARISLADGRTDPYPPVRNGRRLRRLDPCKDRLSYRSAPLGLIDRSRHGDLRFTEGLASGEDLDYTGALWFTSRSIAYDLTGPPYVIHDDAADRVTRAPRDVSQDFGFLDAVETSSWFDGLDARARAAVVVKYVRMHVFDAIQARLSDDALIREHRPELVALISRLRRLSPAAFALLARADAAVISQLTAAELDVDRLRSLLQLRQNYRRVGSIVPTNPFRVLDRQAPLRTLFAGARAMTAQRS